MLEARALAAVLTVATCLPVQAAEPTSAPAEEVRQLGAIKVEGEGPSEGSSDAGYRKDTVSQVGPWQGRELQELPYSITVISSDLIENVQATNSDQLFRINPTTQLRRSQHENDQSGVNLRGFSAQVFYRDGVPGDQYGHGTSIEDVESIEILTGLSGFLYGPGNVGGVVNYVTKRPTVERLNKLTVGSAGGNSLYATGDFGGRIDRDGRFGYRVNAVKQGGETAIKNQEIDKTFVSLVLDWRITDKLLLQVNAADRDYVVDGAQAYWGLAAGVTRPSADDIDTSVSYGQPWTQRKYENEKYGGQLRWEASDALTLRAAWHENNSNRTMSSATNTIQANGSYTQSVSGLYADGVDARLSEQIDERGQAFADFRFETGSVGHKLTTGLMYSHNIQVRFLRNGPNVPFTGSTLERPIYGNLPTMATLDRGPRAPVSDSTSTTWSIGDDITFNEKWSILAGVGHSTIDDADISVVFVSPGYKKSAVTPTVSLVYKPAELITTYASYIEALERGGAAGEEFNGAPVSNAGQVFEPLTSEQFEIGAKASLGDVLLTAALFQIDKALQYYDVSDPTRPTFVQDGRQVHRGVELTAFGKLTENISVIGGLTWLDAKVKEQAQTPALEGKRPTVVSDVLAKIHLEYGLPMLPALTLTGGVNYTSDQYGDALNTDKMAGYTLVDVGARYEMGMGNSLLTLRLDAYNLTDKRYWPNNGYVSDPRTIAVSANVTF